MISYDTEEETETETEAEVEKEYYNGRAERAIIRDFCLRKKSTPIERLNLMNLEIFAKSVERAYPLAKELNLACYSLDEALEIFNCYFKAYRQHMGREHPPLKIRQIADIISCMPFSIGEHFSPVYFEPEYYPALIEKHFNTKYHRCDYNINHFFSGRIRELRFHEVYS